MRIDKKSGDCVGTVEHKRVAMKTHLSGNPVFENTYPKLVVRHTGDNPFVGEVIDEWTIGSDGKEIPGTRKSA